MAWSTWVGQGPVSSVRMREMAHNVFAFLLLELSLGLYVGHVGHYLYTYSQ